jgi:hypothetical protein
MSDASASTATIDLKGRPRAALFLWGRAGELRIPNFANPTSSSAESILKRT